MTTSSFSNDQKAILAKLDDEEWRIDNLYTIKDKYGRIVKFIRNASQIEFWLDMWYLNIILKDRQRGFSTLIAIFILDRCFFNGNTEAGIIDLTLSDAKKKLDKIKLAYDHMPDFLRKRNKMVERNAESVKFENGSSIYIGTSHRGGTLEILHVSEIGKIAARNPERAREIRTGALNTIAQGNIIIYESTAEGTAGEFYDDCQTAQKLLLDKAKLTPLDFKFHFFPWFDGTENEMNPTGIVIPERLRKYFDELEQDLGIQIPARKRAWYVKKDIQQKEDMFREFPSTPEEAFQATIEGAYFSHQIKRMRKDEMITDVPYDPSYPVNTGWDFGLRDKMTIWLHQKVAMQDRLIGYIASDTIPNAEGADVLFFWRYLLNQPFVYGRHFLPHDAGAKRMGTGGTKGDSRPKTLQQILQKAGMKNSAIVPRISNKAVSIQEVKIWIPSAYFDREQCKVGLQCLQNYRREWDDKLGTWKDKPRHDDASHGYDSLETLVRGLNMFGASRAIAESTRHISRAYDEDGNYNYRHKLNEDNYQGSRPPANWRAC